MSTQRPILIWQFDSTATRDGTGSDDGLELNHVCYVQSSQAWFYASTVNAATSSWTAVTAGSGSTLAATLAAGNVTGGTDLEISAADALIMVENATVPWTPVTTRGALWVRNDSPNVLIFTDDGGTDRELKVEGSAPASHAASHENGGADEISVTGLSGVLADNQNPIPTAGVDTSAIHDNQASEISAITNKETPAGGDFLLIEDSAAANAKKHVLVQDLPADALATTLSVGSTTGGTGIEFSSGDPLTLNENTTVPDGAPAAGKGKVWVRDDTPNVLVFTDDAGTDTVLGSGGGGGDDLATVLAVGNTTGGTGIEFSTGDPLTLNENTTVPGGAPGAGTGKLWVRDDAPNVLVFTDDSGADTVLGSGGGGGDNLATVLATGNTTSGSDIVVSAGDALTLTENATVPGGAPSAGTAKVWIKSETPNILFFTDDGGTDRELKIEGTAPATHATTHENGGTDEISVAGLNGLLADPQTPALHSASHENGGSDEINVAGLNGLLADPQTPALHSASHENGGSDEINVAGLSGVLADNQNPIPTAGADTTAIHDNVNSEISAIANKETPAGGDFLIIEDSAAANAKKHVLVQDLPAKTLATTLSTGNVTGGTGIEFTAGDPLTFNENTTVPDGAPAAGEGKLWVRDDAPNVLVFTDDAGTDTVLGSGGGGGDDLATVLTAGNTTGGTDIIVSTGDRIKAPDGTGTQPNLVIKAGDGLNAGDNGGTANLTGGTGNGSGDGGDAILTGGVGGTAGTCPPGDGVVRGGQSRLAGQAAGGASVQGGSGGSVAANGGSVTLLSGQAGTGGGNSGAVNITTANGVGSGGLAGGITLTTGVGVAGNVVGAPISSTSGAGLGTGAGGNNSVIAGAGGATGDGGDIKLTSGAGGSTSGNSGDVNIATADVTSGIEGDVTVRQGATPEANSVRHRTARLVTAPDAGTVTLKNAHTLTANETAVSLRGDVTGMSQTDADDLVRGTFEGTWYRSGGTVSAGVVNITSTGINGALTDSPVWSVNLDVSGDDIRIRVSGSTSGGTNTNVTWVANWTAQVVS